MRLADEICTCVYAGQPMIRVTRINHAPFVVNSDLIEHVETTPDTVISLTNGQKYVVTESVEEIVDKVVEFRQRIFARGEGN